MKRAIVALLLVVTTVAYAAPHQIMVLKAEGTADAATRAAIEKDVVRLAKNVDGKVEAGDITLSDAAAAAGCNVTDASCKDEVLAIFGVDELVATTVTSGSGGVTVTVRRMQKGTSPRAAASTIPRAGDAKLDKDIGPLFGVTVADKPTPGTPGTPPAPAVQQESSRPLNPYEDSTPAPATTTTTATEQPIGTPVDTQPPNRKWQKIGMGVGGGLVLLSFVLWTQASSKQEQIDNASTDTPADFVRLQELEDEADGLAGGGNLFFVAGLVVGGVSAYYYWKKGRAARTQSARITPTVIPNGAGVVLTFGGGQ